MTDLLDVYEDMRLATVGNSGKARNAALRAGADVETEATSLVGYRSAGYLLIIGGESAARAAAEALGGSVHKTLLVTDAPDGAGAIDDALVVLRGSLAGLEGHLGKFVARMQTPNGQALNLSELNGTAHPYFDLVLDLQDTPAMSAEVPPFGYYAPAGNEARLQRALAEIPEMTGEFEKPRFFNYNPDICAHGDSGLTGCTRCLDACPTGAITSLGDLVDVDPYLCQGGGSCAAACPTGAMIYAYPGPRDQLARIRAMLAAYRQAGGETPVLLFHDEEQGAELLREAAADLPEHVLPVRVAEIGAVGMDIWLAGMAYGAAGVVLLDTPAVAASVRRELESQISYTRPLMQGMGLEPLRLQLLPAGQGGAAEWFVTQTAYAPIGNPAAFETFNEKRSTLRLAIDHLHQQAEAPAAEMAMPVGAPFGQVLVNGDACTLCMSCPQVCPTRALTDAGDKPQLNFTEDLCVQCGLCQTACPEDAITLQPRYLFDAEQRRRPRVLNEEEPFHCISCGKAFATASVIGRMTEKLQGHHMFQSEDSLRRLKMCGDCRVTDMFADDLKGGSVPKVYGMESK
ncbi:MAG: 4Fe-4S binding protein [Aquisalimonadaceae bacterium]